MIIGLLHYDKNHSIAKNHLGSRKRLMVFPASERQNLHVPLRAFVFTQVLAMLVTAFVLFIVETIAPSYLPVVVSPRN